MADNERKVTYIYSVVDNMSEQHAKMSAAAKKAGDETAKTTVKQKDLVTAIDGTNNKIESQVALATANADGIKDAMSSAEGAIQTIGASSEEASSKQKDLVKAVQSATDRIESQGSAIVKAGADGASALDEAKASAEMAGAVTDETIIKQRTLAEEVRRATAEIADQATGPSDGSISAQMDEIKKASEEAGIVTDDTISKQSDLEEAIRQAAARIDEQNDAISQGSASAASDMGKVKQSATEAGTVTDNTILKQRQLAAEAKNATTQVKSQNVSIIMQLTAVMGFKEGISSLTNGVISLGLVSEDSAKTLMKFNSAFQMMAGGVQIIKAAQGVMAILNLETLKNAILNTYNAVVSNPGKAMLVGLGLGAAAGAGTYFALSSIGNNTNVSNNITVNGDPTPGQQATAEKLNQVYSMTGAGGYI